MKNQILHQSDLQKILYFAYGIHISVKDKRLFTAPIVALECGADIECVHNMFNNGKPSQAIIMHKYASMKQRSVLIACWVYYNANTRFLYDRISGGNSAWLKAWSKCQGGVINDEDIKDEFFRYHTIVNEYIFPKK